MLKVAHVFPGQGSQVVGMGRDLYDSSRRARKIFKQADRALDFPLSRLCFEGPPQDLTQTMFAQPAIMTVSVACLEAASEAKGLVEPAFVAGHSLGEYTALVAAGVIEFGDAVRLVWERGRLMQEAGVARPGGMAAVIGVDEYVLEEICQETGAQIANVNSPGQIVISGSRETLARAVDLARARGARHAIPLDVSGAFHSALMEPAAQGIARALSQVKFHNPRVPIIGNSTAMPLTTAAAVRQELRRQICHCVHWRPSVQFMVGEGVSTFVEIGPGKVLAGLIKRIDGNVQVVNMSDMASIKALPWRQ